MATSLPNYYLTLADLVKRVNPDGALPRIVELLNQTNEILQDMPFVAGNLSTGHRSTVRTGLPSVVWTKLYKGVASSKSETMQVDDTCGRAESRSEIDVRLVELTEAQGGFIANEQVPFFEAFNQTMAGGFFYFDTALDPTRFLGLAARYPTSATANVLSAGGTGSQLTSVWLIGWGPNTVHGITPKNVPGGLRHEYRGVEKCFDASGAPYYAHVNTYEWNIGICVRDWRYIVRLANVNMASNPANGVFSLNMLVEMLGTLPSWRLTEGKLAFYMHKNLWTQLMILAMNKSNAALGWEDVMGHKVLSFWGIPIRQVDQLLLTETAI
jgi:hypothetical protein